jgi:hypothetical protein
MVTPATFRSFRTKGTIGCNWAKGQADVPATWVNVWSWAEPSFRVYTPFKVTVLKNGAVIGETTLNAEGLAKTQIISTTLGDIRVENLGNLVGEYMNPTVPSNIGILSGDNVYDYGITERLIKFDQGAIYDPDGNYVYMDIVRSGSTDCYGAYWYGRDYRWDVNVDPAHVPAGFTSGTVPAPISGSLHGGWLEHDDLMTIIRDPVKPVIYYTDKSASSFPVEKRGFQSLTEYIEAKLGSTANLANSDPLFGNPDLWTIDAINRKLYVYVPWGAYQMPLVQFRVPVEMADTWVDRPPVSDVRPIATWARTGTTSMDIYGSERVAVQLTQFSNVKSSTVVKAVWNDQKIGVYPLERTETLGVGENKTVLFDVTNLGDTVDYEGDITFACYETYTMSQTGNSTVHYKRKALTQNITELRVLVQDPSKSSYNKGVAGISIQIMYPPQNGETMEGFTDQEGYIRWTLGTQYSGDVYIHTIENFEYKAAFRTVHVNPGFNDVTVDLVKQSLVVSTDSNWLLYAVLGIVAVVALGAGIKNRKRLKL